MIEIRKIPEEERNRQGINNWPVWKKEVSRFPYTYEEEEWCYFIEGEVIIETESGNYHILPGDFVIFRTGLNCVWDIRMPVTKKYKFL